MKTLAAAPLLLLSACSTLSDVPSLAPRPIEAVVAGTTAEPAPSPAIVTAAPDPVLSAKIDAILQDARAGGIAFDDVDRRNAPAISAGAHAASGSDAWVNGQTALSALEAARLKTADALAAIDQLLSHTVESAGSDSSPAIDQITEAQESVSAIVARQNARLAELTR